MKNVDFEAVAQTNETDAIGIAYETNGLFSLNLANRTCEYKQMIQGEAPMGKRLYVAAVVSDKKVYFVPASAKEIAVYNTDSNTISKLSFRIPEDDNYNPKKNFSGAVCFGNFIFMVPWTYPSVIRIDTMDDSIEYFDEWVSDDPFDFRKSIYVEGNRFFIPSAINNIVFEFDMQKCKGKIHHVDENNKGCWSICKAQGKLWLSPVGEGPIICWDVDVNKTKDYSAYPYGYQGNGFCFTKNYLVKDRIYFISAFGNMSISLDLNSEILEKCDVEELNGKDSISCMYQIGNNLFLKTVKEENEKSICLNMNDNSITDVCDWIVVNLQEYIGDLLKIQMQNDDIFRENNRFGLSDFLEGI